MRITITRSPILGWIITRPHWVTGLDQTVAHDQDRAEAIRKAETAMGVSFPQRVKVVKEGRSGSRAFDLEIC